MFEIFSWILVSLIFIPFFAYLTFRSYKNWRYAKQTKDPHMKLLASIRLRMRSAVLLVFVIHLSIGLMVISGISDRSVNVWLLIFSEFILGSILGLFEVVSLFKFDRLK